MDIADLEREERLLEQARSTRWRLRLPPGLLGRFHAERNAADLRSSCVAVLCAIVVLDSFIFSDAKMVSDVVGLAVLVRLAVLTPLAFLYVPLAIWLVRRNPSTIWHHVYTAWFATVIVGWVCLVQVQTREPTGNVFYAGAYLVIVFYTASIRGPLYVRVPAIVTMVVLFAASMPFVTVISATQRVDASLLMVGFCAFGLLGSYREEHSARQRFLLNCRTKLLEARRELLLGELASANERLSVQATRDALTGVPNRRAIDDAMATWGAGEPVAGALLVVDLDHFKAYNDAFGHQGGDAVLRQVARAMSESLRGGEAMLARYGGEEFVAVLRGVSALGARRAAERLRAAVEKQQIPLPETLRLGSQRYVSVSVGGAWTSSSRSCSAEELLGRADAALYEAKSGGRNLVRFSPSDDDVKVPAQRQPLAR